jgi:serine/threonine protein kinase
VDYTHDIADALYYAHQRGIVHRDIKPDNILLGPNSEIWVGDFGIATPSYTRQQMPKTQPVVGTYPYMAPEHWEGHASSASDQYSLGIMVYKWLCGSCPFNGNDTAIYQQHKSDSPPPLHEKFPTISPAVERVVLKALAKKPQDRFENVMTFANALERAASGGVVQPIKRSPTLVIPSTPFASAPVGKRAENPPKPPTDPNEQLFQEGVRAQVNKNVEEAFRIYQQLVATPSIAEKYSTAAKKRIEELRKQMIPIRLKQARLTLLSTALSLLTLS